MAGARAAGSSCRMSNVQVCRWAWPTNSGDTKGIVDEDWLHIRFDKASRSCSVCHVISMALHKLFTCQYQVQAGQCQQHKIGAYVIHSFRRWRTSSGWACCRGGAASSSDRSAMMNIAIQHNQAHKTGR